MEGGVGVEADGVFEVGSDAVDSCDNLVDGYDEPSWRSAGSLWRIQPPKEVVGVQEAVRGIVCLRTAI